MDPLVDKFELLDQALSEVSNPLLVIHPKPDVDALGSSFGFAEYLKKRLSLNKIDIFSVDRPGTILSSLFPLQNIIYEFDINNYDAIFFLDRVDLYYKLEIETLLKNTDKKISIFSIDHHPNSFIPNSLNLLDTKASATSEIIFRFIDYVQHSPDTKTAQYLLNGIYADTGGFKHNNTSPEALEISGILVRKGASITKINRALYANKSLNTLKLWGIALERAQINPKTGMAVSFITKEDLDRCGATAEDIGGISEILNTISDSRFSLVLSQREKNKIKASLRSDEHKKVDVSKIARQFSGGGHKLASGFEIKGSLRQVGDSWIIE